MIFSGKSGIKKRRLNPKNHGNFDCRVSEFEKC
jgi:hypothetical protein